MADWDGSNQNPLVCMRIDQANHMHHGKDEDNAEIAHEQSKKPWIDKFIISQMNTAYIVYNIFICILCIVSSYYYASFIGFRYIYNLEEERIKMIINMAVFEGFFLIHFLLQFILEF